MVVNHFGSIPMTFCCNICIKHSPLQCLGSSTSTSTFKVMPFSLFEFCIAHDRRGYAASDYGFLCFPAVFSGQPSSISDDAEVVTLIGSCQDAANQLNQKEIHWGVSRWTALIIIFLNEFSMEFSTHNSPSISKRIKVSAAISSVVSYFYYFTPLNIHVYTSSHICNWLWFYILLIVSRRFLRRTLGEGRRFAFWFWKDRRREQRGGCRWD